MFVKFLKAIFIVLLVIISCFFLIAYTLFAIGNITGVVGALAAIAPEIIVLALAVYFLKSK